MSLSCVLDDVHRNLANEAFSPSLLNESLIEQ